MSNKTLAQVASAAGPDPEKLGAALQIIDFGQVLQAQRALLLGVSAGVFKLPDNVPPLRAGAIAKIGSGAASTQDSAFISKGSFAVTVPSTGLTVGAGNAAVRVVPKPGYTVRYAQFNPGGPADTGNYFLASQPLKVFISIAGKFAEIWVSLANDATAALTSLSSAVQAALLADPAVMSVLDAVDGNGGDGSSAAVASPLAALDGFRPSCGAKIAAGMAVFPAASPGTFVSSSDGRMLFFHDTVSSVMLEYAAAPAQPMDSNLYPGSM